MGYLPLTHSVHANSVLLHHKEMLLLVLGSSAHTGDTLLGFYQISPFSHLSAWKGNKQCLPRHLVLLPTHASRRLSSREQLWSLICPTHLKPRCQGTCLVPASFQEESCWGLGDASQHTAVVEKTPLCQMQQFPESDQRSALVSSEFLKWVVLLSSFA